MNLVYREEEWPHGLRCAQCDHLLSDGERYSQRLHGFQDDVPILLVVCASCAVVGETEKS
jgi:RNase P subunit RPR2